MATVHDFNNTLFELTDEMIAIIKPSTVLTTAYSVFKNMHATNPGSPVVLQAFWAVAKDNKEVIASQDVTKMAEVLRTLVPVPGMVDEILEALSDENRQIVAEYISVLYDQASTIEIKDIPKEESGASSTTMYSMYNEIWKDFLVHLENACTNPEKKQLVADAREKMAAAVDAKGPSTDMIFAVMFPSLKPVLPKQAMDNEADILRLCMPPTDIVPSLKRSVKLLRSVPFPFNRNLPFSDLLSIILKSKGHVDKLGTFWHYIKLLTMCVNECPPEVLGMMNQMIAFFNQGLAPTPTDLRLRDVPAVLTK